MRSRLSSERREGSGFPRLAAKTQIPRSARNDKRSVRLRCSSRERQQRDVARHFDRVRQAVLMRRTHAGQAPRHDLAAFGHELAEHAVIFVVDVFDFLGAELANFLAPEELASTAAAFARRSAGAACTAAAAVTRMVPGGA